MVILTSDTFTEEKKYEEYFNTFPNLSLSPFQNGQLRLLLMVIIHLLHTGSGKLFQLNLQFNTL